MMHPIYVRRVYDVKDLPENRDKEARFLVDRLWPRGVKKESLHMDAWLKEAAPSTALREWYHHDVSKWDEFCDRYDTELDAHPETWQPIVDAARHRDVVLLYAARDIEHNQAIALKQYLEQHHG